MNAGFSQILFLHLLIWSYNFYPSKMFNFMLCDFCLNLKIKRERMYGEKLDRVNIDNSSIRDFL